MRGGDRKRKYHLPFPGTTPTCFRDQMTGQLSRAAPFDRPTLYGESDRRPAPLGVATPGSGVAIADPDGVSVVNPQADAGQGLLHEIRFGLPRISSAVKALL